MAKNVHRDSDAETGEVRINDLEEKKQRGKVLDFFMDKRLHISIGIFLLLFSIFVFISIISYFFNGKIDQSLVHGSSWGEMKEAFREVKNWFGVFGSITSHYFVFRGFGVGSLFIPPFLFIVGFRIVFRYALYPLGRAFAFCSFAVLWICLTFGLFLKYNPSSFLEYSFLSGAIGYELAEIIDGCMGWGGFLLLLFFLFLFIIYFFNFTEFYYLLEKIKNPKTENITEKEEKPETEDKKNTPNKTKPSRDNQNIVLEVDNTHSPKAEEEQVPNPPLSTKKIEMEIMKNEPAPVDKQVFNGPVKYQPSRFENAEGTFEVVELEDEAMGVEVKNYDPTLDLPQYEYPNPNLLHERPPSKIQVTKEELEANKDKIIETLNNFDIGIAQIKATIGPTVTLYEIIPQAGVRISKIKNLEDDIALSLSALGIRIIAPMPGKGTIGIEVPNKKKEMVDMRSVLATEKFLKSEMDLPIVLGKTISNEVYVTDLAKMPHLLMAGATGQGKSVGLNVILTSLLYKKHPSQLKLVLVDPKKVELTPYNKIEKHFLATLPDVEEPIITDTKKVVNTLNSLCIEMDSRYDLLKIAGSRNIKEYNEKFITRRLNPKNGHRYLPYIVLVIDELADLMMTAGKEVELPIARIAQLARAIGIHLVVATQRPSVNVITGTIKANFPARLSFRVASKIDARTILDTGGAEQLVGQGDMLLSLGSDIIRLQCAFVDTDEVENICSFIEKQNGYPSAYLLPEYVGEEEEGTEKDINLADRDPLFEEAARLIITHQIGSTSLIQRKMKLGYARSGRIMDQLEAAGIVGPMSGGKPRNVTVATEDHLEKILQELNRNSPI